MEILWHDAAWNEYLWWQANDRAALKRLNRMLKEAARNPSEGIGKPEKLRGDWSGWWSRRITDEHRLVYKLRDGVLIIAACRSHYGDK